MGKSKKKQASKRKKRSEQSSSQRPGQQPAGRQKGATRSAKHAVLPAGPNRSWWRQHAAVLRLAASFVAVGVILLVLMQRDATPSEMPVNLRFSTGTGKSTVALTNMGSRVGMMCGCADPTFSGIPWSGVLLPLDEYDLGVTDPASSDNRLFRVVIDTPTDGDAADSSEVPIGYRAVESTRGQAVLLGQGKVRYRGDPHKDGHFIRSVGTKQITVVSDKRIHIHGYDKWPLTVLNPALETTLSFDTTSGAHGYEPSTLQMTADVDSDSHGETASSSLDMAGPARLQLRLDASTRVYLGSERLDLSPRGLLDLNVRAPLTAARLTVSSVSSSDVATMDSYAAMHHTAVTKLSHLNTGVIPGGLEASGPYRLEIADGQTPSAQQWAAFYKYALPDKSGTSGFPTVPAQRQIDIYGPVSSFESRNLVGTLATSSGRSSTVAQGSQVAVTSKKGFTSGKYVPSLSLSSGSSTIPTQLSGNATAKVGASALTDKTPAKWPPNLCYFLLTAIGAIIIERVIMGPQTD